MLGDPDADYINANYIDVSASPRCVRRLALAAPGSLSGQGGTRQGRSRGSRGWISERPHLLQSVPGSSAEGRTGWATAVRRASLGWGVSEAEWRQEGRQPGLEVRTGPFSVRGPEAGGGVLTAHSQAESGRGWTVKASNGRLRSWAFFLGASGSIGSVGL